MQMGRDAAWPGSRMALVPLQGILQSHVRRELAFDLGRYRRRAMLLTGARFTLTVTFRSLIVPGRANPRFPTGILTFRSRRVSVMTALWGTSRRLSSGKRLHFGLTNPGIETAFLDSDGCRETRRRHCLESRLNDYLSRCGATETESAF